MIKVLIVDDEFIIREGLKTFPWSDYGCEVVGEAENGEEGLLAIRALQPDIVFTDIRMPGMDGLALAKEIELEFPHIAILLLTGYDDFSYAQEAVRLGIRDYILKPTDFQVIGEMLQKLIDSIHATQAKQEYYRKMQRRMESALPYLRSRLIGDLMNGRYFSEEEARKNFEVLEMDTGAYVVVSAAGSPRRPGRPGDSRERQLLELSIEDICMNRFREYAREAIVCANRQRMVFLLVFASPTPDGSCTAAALKACSEIQQSAAKQLEADLSFGIGGPTRCLTQLYNAGIEANRALDHRFFIGENAIIPFSDLNMNKRALRSLSLGTIDDLHGMVCAGNTAAIRSFFQELSQELSNGGTGEIGEVRKRIIELVLRVAWAANNSMETRAEDSLSEFEFMQSALSCPTQEQLLSLAQDTICRLADRCREEFNVRSGGIVGKIVRYIHDHHMDDLSLDLLAEHFQLSSAYISRLLRNKTGKSFMEILANDRMEHAKKLLKSGRYKVNEVAETVGYQDLSYFIQTFKKRFGMTPNEYKNLK